MSGDMPCDFSRITLSKRSLMQITTFDLQPPLRYRSMASSRARIPEEHGQPKWKVAY